MLCCAVQVLLVKFNKARQAKITQEISEIVAGANATG
jgi:F0F1-type ATP synthase gamma subunit